MIHMNSNTNGTGYLSTSTQPITLTCKCCGRTFSAPLTTADLRLLQHVREGYCDARNWRGDRTCDPRQGHRNAM